MPLNWIVAQWVLSIWNPDLMDFITYRHRRDSMRLLYRTNGIVLHDRLLNGERVF